jgi:hypothetical protein
MGNVMTRSHVLPFNGVGAPPGAVDAHCTATPPQASDLVMPRCTGAPSNNSVRSRVSLPILILGAIAVLCMKMAMAASTTLTVEPLLLFNGQTSIDAAWAIQQAKWYCTIGNCYYYYNLQLFFHRPSPR